MLGAAHRITLYTYAMSPYAAKVHCFLLYKRLPFECYYIHPFRIKHELPVGRQIPVVTIGDESRADSTPIGCWLDERFPQAPRLLPASRDERERLLELDDWVSQHLIPATFRFAAGEGWSSFVNGWRLADVMHRTAQGGLPAPLRAAWPLLLTRAPFVRRLIEQADDGLPLRESRDRLYRQLLAHLDGGPFFAGRQEPSMPDLAAYPQIVLHYQTGFRYAEDLLAHRELVAWTRRVAPYLDGMPPLVPAAARRRPHP